VDVDLSLAWLPFEHEALRRATSVDFGGVRLPVAAVDDLIVLKAVPGGLAIAATSSDCSSSTVGALISCGFARRSSSLLNMLEEPSASWSSDRLVSDALEEA